MSDYGFVFSLRKNDVFEGAVDAFEEIFSTQTIGDSVVRELVQNSLDARAENNSGPVVIEVELKEIKTSEIPDIDNLRSHLTASVKAVDGSNDSSNRLQLALEALSEETIAVLRVGDYGTTGLEGDEDDYENISSLAALTRGNGFSIKNYGAGGSFGIGAKAASGASSIRTVFWQTKSQDHPIPVIAGRAMFAAHKNEEYESEMFSPHGLYRKLDDQSFRLKRTTEGVLGFSPRTHLGTDTFIMGYRGPNENLELNEIRRAFAQNFMAAIHSGMLVVKGSTREGNWQLDQKLLGDFISEDQGDNADSARAYYSALLEDPEIIDVAGLGTVRAFIKVDPDLKETYKPKYMRKPCMKIFIDTGMHRLSQNFAAIVLCDSDEANNFARSIEPPTHDSWNPKTSGEKRRFANLRSAVRRAISAKIKRDVGVEFKITGLSRILPTTLIEGKPSSAAALVKKTGSTEQQGSKASTRENEKLKGKTLKEAVSSKKVTPEGHFLKISAKASGGTERATSLIKNTDPAKKDAKQRTGLGLGSASEGNSQIRGDRLLIRQVFPKPGEVRLLIRPIDEKQLQGDIFLVPVSEGNKLETKYGLGIEEVRVFAAEGDHLLNFEGNLIKDLVIPENGTELTIRFSRNRRFSLAVK